ncbi:MAG: CBS domain-containing protein [Candidatus Omnitrophica bacterium]|nr:CBS domain-containing protein [Candidatus Omnitrophota bacterium]
MIHEALSSIKLKDVMTSPVITVQEWEDFHVVQDKLEAHDIRHLPVVDDSGRLVGMISQRHLYKICSPRRMDNGGWHYDKDMLDSFILKRVMVRDVYILRPDNTVADAIKDMVQFKIGCIPILDDSRRPVGIVTRDDILAHLLKL